MKPIGMIELTRLINKASEDFDCGKCLWENECGKIKCGCSVAMTIRALVEDGYLEIEKRKKEGVKHGNGKISLP